MKKISILILIVLSLLITSCSKIKTTDNAEKFCKYVYDISRGKIKRGAVIDLRDLETDRRMKNRRKTGGEECW